MTDFLALPPAARVRGTVAAPSSKSATNRALLLAALGQAPVEIVRPLESEDTLALSGCLTAMGASIERIPEGLRVSGPLGVREGRTVLLDARDSGTAARLLLAAAAASPGRFRLTGSTRLRERPMEELVLALAQAGVRIEFEDRSGYLPLTVHGGTLSSGAIRVDASRSSQFLSALLLAAVAVKGGLSISAEGEAVSLPYVRLTLEMLRGFGHRVVETSWISVRRGVAPPSRYEVPGDYSSALPLLAACGAAGGEVTVTGLASDSVEADALALPVLEEMGIAVSREPFRVTASAERDRLRPISVAASDYPDAVPTLAALAALARGRSRFRAIGHLRHKESDRIAALATLLERSGARASAGSENLEIEGPACPPGGARLLPTFRDHRIVMAAALLSLARPGLMIESPDCVAKSYPRFFRDLETIVVREPVAGSR
jgi:3-phosphoshikimate 1-carboxyvinyltransferase